ncbi:MAG: hypothetical protein Ct9H90mP20_0640 [Candidatus Neomarinimicrobiota bacterium]|nr:MAG: hypothetical protein Ct9H90mP20_0640 [Candidatus Neomarinimicrobiota bacterium]
MLSSGIGKLFESLDGKLPTPPMLMMDRIIHISDQGGAYGKGEIKAELDIDKSLWFFDCHFKMIPLCLDVWGSMVFGNYLDSF